ncbi:MAG: hypothetical protein ACE5FT_00065 [Candidatus Nanoarchaeia archaeon]
MNKTWLLIATILLISCTTPMDDSGLKTQEWELDYWIVESQEFPKYPGWNETYLAVNYSSREYRMFLKREPTQPKFATIFRGFDDTLGGEFKLNYDKFLTRDPKKIKVNVTCPTPQYCTLRHNRYSVFEEYYPLPRPIEEYMLFSESGEPLPAVNISDEARTCESDNDCTYINPVCSDCSCGMAINKESLSEHLYAKRKICTRHPPGGICDIDCPKQTFKCVDSQCVIIEEEW